MSVRALKFVCGVGAPVYVKLSGGLFSSARLISTDGTLSAEACTGHVAIGLVAEGEGSVRVPPEPLARVADALDYARMRIEGGKLVFVQNRLIIEIDAEPVQQQPQPPPLPSAWVSAAYLPPDGDVVIRGDGFCLSMGGYRLAARTEPFEARVEASALRRLLDLFKRAGVEPREAGIAPGYLCLARSEPWLALVGWVKCEWRRLDFWGF